MRKNVNLFALASSNMPGIDTKVVYHRLYIDSTMKLVSQMIHKVGGEKQVTIDEEVLKLRMVGFINDVKCLSWMANVFMVGKFSNKWCICIDFKDLNAS